ncbi:acyltransferase [Paenibacillus sp. P96]|uniref:Acyltransferase n=1 Tax=Paenibacillus zeirhizosphaerae TaxID=2987519 RepID=A0ABT9FXN2_9BACL|nr:acyltransferase [Paenibacillus sp. P96]MDP4099490.1 acyltransferase [Paenibacillus sp. P96]
MVARQKERLPQLDIFRAIAILGVLHVHATSYAAGVQALDSPYYFILNFANIFFKYGTPSFIFLSSFVLFYNYYDRPLNRELVSRFYGKRLGYILLPYVVISIGYFVVSQQVNGLLGQPLMEQLTSFVGKLLTGSVYTHLYFVFISVQFYILFPFILKLLQSSRFVVRWAIPIGLALQWIFIFLNKYEWQIPNKGSYAISYLAYYMMGAFVALHFDKFRGWLKSSWRKMSADQKRWTFLLWGYWLIVSLFHVTLWYYGRHDDIWVNSLWYELLWNVHTMLSSLVLLQAAFRLYDQASQRVVTFLIRLGEASFAIYLVHPLILAIYRRFRYYIPIDSFTYVVWIWGGLLAALFMTWFIVVCAFRYVPFVRFFLGSVPKSYLAVGKIKQRHVTGLTQKADV